MTYRGETFSQTLDGPRVKTQLQAVKKVMDDGQWHTLAQIVLRLKYFPYHIRASEAGVSARIRDLRKPAFGGYVIEHRRVRNGGGLWEYRLVPPEGQGSLL